MRKLILFICLFLGVSSLYAQEAEWEEFRSYEGRFRVLFPGEPIFNVDTIETPLGNLAYHTYYYQPKDSTSDNLLYLLSYCDYPENIFHADSSDLIEAFFETTVEAATEALYGELIYSTDRDYLDHPGKFWRIDYLDGQAVMKTRAFLIGQRFYSLQAASYKGKSLNPSTDRFIDSIYIVEKEEE